MDNGDDDSEKNTLAISDEERKKVFSISDHISNYGCYVTGNNKKK